MIKVIALLLALGNGGVGNAASNLTGLAVSPVGEHTEVVVLVDGGATVAADFMLPDGRLVVDIKGVADAPRLDIADFNRGGVRQLRIAPYQPGVARLVLQLAGPAEYVAERQDGRIRITFRNTAGQFQPWSHGITGDAAAVSQLERPAVRAVAQQEPPIRQQEISVSFDSQPLSFVAGFFSEFAGRTIITSSALRTRSITAEVRGMGWRQALETILDAENLYLRERPDGAFIIEQPSANRERLDAEPTDTRAFQIQYVSADSIRQAVQGLLTSVGRVTVNSSSNSLLVTDVVSALDRVSRVIPDLDVKTPQVDIAARIAFIDRTALESFGVIYDLKDSRGSQLNSLVTGLADTDGDGVLDPVEDDVILLGGNSIAGLGNANYRIQQPSLEFVSTLLLGRHSLISFIEALQTVNLSDIEAKPSLRTMDHRTARIQVGEETPVRVIDAGAATTGQQAPRATVQLRPTGVILEVTPHITGNQVLLDINAERSNVGVAPGDIGILFQTQNAQTQVLANDGETVVIGGLTIVEKTQSRTGIPLLMDLPVIGKLFRRDEERENKRDLLIMVTPYIVRD